MTELPTESAAPSTESAAPSTEELAAGAAAPAATAAPRPGVPVWRVGKPDAFLAAAVDTARNAVLEIAADKNIGPHTSARSEGIRTVTHLFECKLPGYVGWQWFATLTRISRSKDATVNEVGLLPTEGSVLAPPWVPWAERVRPEDAKPGESEESSGANESDDQAGEGDSGHDAGSLAGAGEAPED